MRILPLALVLAACGGSRGAATALPPVVAAFPAARFIPARPSYVVAARTFGDAQRALHDLTESFGMLAEIEPRDVSRELEHVLGVDPLSAAAVGGIGVDVAGGLALFSEDLDPTFVVHLAAPEALQAFLDHQRQLGMVTQSVIVDGAEVFTAKIDRKATLSWAVDKDWLWLHLGLGHSHGTTWFAHSHRPEGAEWTTDWAWAQGLASRAAGLVGYVGLRDLVMTAASRVPEALACARLFQPVERVGLAIEGDGRHAAARLSLDLGPAARGVVRSLLAPPPGWAAASAGAPLAAQWNLDVRALLAWLAPCTQTIAVDPGELAQLGVTAGRAMLLTFDPGDTSDLDALRSATGAVALDLAPPTPLQGWLDAIPGRSTFESERSYGAYRGHHVAVPFVMALDYVLDDHVALAALGDGVLARIASGTPAAALPVASLELRPPGLPPSAWRWLFAQAQIPDRKRMVERLMGWAEAHVAVTIEHDALVIEAAGNRR